MSRDPNPPPTARDETITDRMPRFADPTNDIPVLTKKNQRGSYGSRGGFRGGRGRGTSVNFGDRRGVYVTGTVEDERENEVTSTPQHESDLDQEPEPPRPAWPRREDENGYSENDYRQLPLSPFSCRNPQAVRTRHGRKTSSPRCDTDTPIMDEDESGEP